MDLKTTKIVVAVLFGFIRFFFGIFPVKLYNILKRWEGDDDTNTFINQKRHTQVSCAIALCQSFGGGVLFATCFLHMMLEVHNSVEDLKKFGNVNTDYPLSQMIICVGFLFVYFLEEMAHWLITKVPEKPYPPIRKQFNNFTSSSVTPLGSTSTKRSAKAFFIEDEYEKSKEADNVSNKDIDEDQKSSQKLNNDLGFDTNGENIVYDALSLNSEVARENDKNLELNKEVDIANEIEVECVVKSQQQIMRCVLVVLALSFHGIFEGFTIGLQKNTANIWYLFVAVSIHSATIHFCMGLELLLAKARTKRIYILMIVLALVSPFGILLGLLVTIKNDMETEAKFTAVALLEGLSAGTILYITFFEVLNREKERRICRLYRSLCIIAGFSLMAFLQYLKLCN